VKPTWIPNALTLARIALVGPILWCLAEGWLLAGGALFAVAGVTDALDGWLARRLDARSALGAALDPLADKMLLVGTFVLLAWQGVLPVWLAGLVVARDLAILLGAAVVRLRWGAFAPRPSRLSKANTAAQVALVVVALGQPLLPVEIGAAVLSGLVVTVTLTTLGSGLGYAWTAWHRLRDRQGRTRA
jgi:cardiolipin synthase